MTGEKRRRFTLARLALIAWLGFVVVASATPFLIFADLTIYGDRSGFDTIDAIIRDGAVVVRSGSWRGYEGGFFAPFVTWRPGASDWFNFGMYSQGSAYLHYSLWVVKFPPWLVLLVPTLLAMIAHRFFRHRAARKLKRPGRTPCPTCHYDATGLSICPECGAAQHTQAPATA